MNGNTGLGIRSGTVKDLRLIYISAMPRLVSCRRTRNYCGCLESSVCQKPTNGGELPQDTARFPPIARMLAASYKGNIRSKRQ